MINVRCLRWAFAIVLATTTGAWARADDAFSFTDDDGRTYGALLRFPDPDLAKPIGYTAMLIGGGSVTDMHWTVPGSVEHEGESIRLTIDGEPTRDADTIVAAFLDHGFMVMQWSSIHRDDAKRAKDPASAEYVTYEKTRAVARDALAALRAREGVDPEKIVLVGHSLGAARAVQIAADDEGVRGLGLLAPAKLSRLEGRAADAAPEVIDALAELGMDADAGIEREVFESWSDEVHPLVRAYRFETLDVDHDGLLRRWEIASWYHFTLERKGDTRFHSDADSLAGEPLPFEIVRSRQIPTIIVCGGLDPLTYHTHILYLRARLDGASWLKVDIRTGLGHQLGPEVRRDNEDHAAVAGSALVGPIDDYPAKRLATWLRSKLTSR